MWLIFLGIMIAIFVVLGLRSANESYTAGSGMFKRSEGNLQRDEHLDASDYNYYNTTDKLK